MPESIKGKKGIIYSILISVILLVWVQRDIFFVSTGIGFRLLELIFTVCMIIALTWVIYYLLIEKSDIIVRQDCISYYLKLFLVQTVAFFPLYTQNFMYGDDLWMFASDFNGHLSQGLYFSRPFLNFAYGIVKDTSFLSIRYFRIYNGIVLFIFGCIMFRYLVIRGIKCNIAFLYAAIAIASCTAVDCIAYASIFPINMSLMLSAISFIIYLKAKNVGGMPKIIFLVESGICLFSAFCFYQIGTPVVFVMYVIAEKTKEIKLKKNITDLLQAMAYLLYYGITTVLYLLITKVLQFMTGIVSGQSARSEIILSLNQINKKMTWFITEVCPQTFTRLTGVLFGNSLFKEKNMFYHCTYSKSSLGFFLSTVFVILIVLSIIDTARKQRNLWMIIISIVAIPLSFWPFLILPESAFTTYYAIGIILLFLWYVCDGMVVIVDLVRCRLKSRHSLCNISENAFVCILIMVLLLKSNIYAENTWVNYNRDLYEYLANSIVAELNNNDEIDTIIVKGNMGQGPGGGHDYVIFCVNNILREMGYEPDNYQVVQSENGYYPLIFNDGDAAQMENILGEKLMDKVLDYYMHDDMYGRWLASGVVDSDEERKFLKECFIKTGLMAEENERTILVSMEGFNIRNTF